MVSVGKGVKHSTDWHEIFPYIFPSLCRKFTEGFFHFRKKGENRSEINIKKDCRCTFHTSVYAWYERPCGRMAATWGERFLSDSSGRLSSIANSV